MANSAMKTTTWLKTGAFDSGRKNDALDRHAGDERNAMVTPNATQNGTPHCISCQAMKVENIAISPCAKLMCSIAW